jgi:methylenetetrahydrofolate reductase (NADPH)
VYVNHLPRQGLLPSLAALGSLHEAGLEPVPHIAARRVASRQELTTFLTKAVREAGVTKVLLIGGDDPQPLGPYKDGIQLLRERILADCGVREVGLPGYPEGHPRILQTALDQALVDKLALAESQGLGASIVTQFSFAPARIVEYCDELARKVPDIPVYVGMAGPTDAVTLLRFAQRCGVSSSLRAMGAQGMGAVKLFMHTDPGEQLSAVAHYSVRHADCNVVGAHLFSFGAAARSAGWMNRVITARNAPG